MDMFSQQNDKIFYSVKQMLAVPHVQHHVHKRQNVEIFYTTQYTLFHKYRTTMHQSNIVMSYRFMDGTRYKP